MPHRRFLFLRVRPLGRVGFVAAGLAASGNDVIALARSYRAIADADYLRDPTVGAMRSK